MIYVETISTKVKREKKNIKHEKKDKENTIMRQKKYEKSFCAFKGATIQSLHPSTL